MDVTALPGGPMSQGEQALWFLLSLLTLWGLIYLVWKSRGGGR